MYAHNLKAAAPDVDKMKNSLLTMFFHMMSTNVAYNHHLCPAGIDSWCHFRAAEAGATNARDHNPIFTSDVGPLIYPVFQRLSDRDLLQRCAKMGTQNANESFNSLIWDRAPKTMFLNRQSIVTATSLAILDFNCGLFGLKFISDHLGLVWTDRLKNFCETKTVEKLRKANVRANEDFRVTRKIAKKFKNAANRDRKKKEGKTYEAALEVGNLGKRQRKK